MKLTVSPRFIRSTLTSLLTTAFDFAVLTGSVELLHVNYVLATWFGTVVGSVSNFTINKNWAFKGSMVPLPHQLGRFVLVQAGSSAWNTLGVWLMTDYGGFRYPISKLIVAAVVALAWNYPMNRLVVFGHKDPKSTRTNEPSGS